MDTRISLKTVGTYQDVFEADLARVTLEAEGVQAVLVNRFGVAMGPYASGMTGARLQVREQDAERARGFLDAIERGRRERLDRETAEPDVKCPRCGSTNLSWRWRRMKVFVWLLLIVGPVALGAGLTFLALMWGVAILSALVMKRENVRCQACGWRWLSGEGEMAGASDAEESGG